MSDWVRANVLPHLPSYGDPAWMTRTEIALAIRGFVYFDPTKPEKPEFWAYYADYDWVALCQLFGTMMGLPDHFPKFCRDLKQLSCDFGSPPHPPKPASEHNALVDARWNRDLYKFLVDRQTK